MAWRAVETVEGILPALVLVTIRCALLGILVASSIARGETTLARLYPTVVEYELAADVETSAILSLSDSCACGMTDAHTFLSCGGLS